MRIFLQNTFGTDLNLVCVWFDFLPPILGIRPIHLASILDELLEGFTRMKVQWDGDIYFSIIGFDVLLFDSFFRASTASSGPFFGFYSLFLDLLIQLCQDRPLRESMSFQKK
jgi:hypothetical protein